MLTPINDLVINERADTAGIKLQVCTKMATNMTTRLVSALQPQMMMDFSDVQ